MFCFLLKLVLLLQLSNSINQFKLGANAATQSEVYERMSKIEANNQLQANEISVLKTKSVEDRNEIQQLKDRLAKLEAFTFTNKTNDQETFERQKRPARLLPSQVLRWDAFYLNMFLLNIIYSVNLLFNLNTRAEAQRNQRMRLKKNLII